MVNPTTSNLEQEARRGSFRDWISPAIHDKTFWASVTLFPLAAVLTAAFAIATPTTLGTAVRELSKSAAHSLVIRNEEDIKRAYHPISTEYMDINSDNVPDLILYMKDRVLAFQGVQTIDGVRYINNPLHYQIDNQ